MVSNVDKKLVDGERAVRLCNYVDVYKHDAITDKLPFMDATASMDQIARFTLRAGDVLITKDSETPDDIAVSAYVPEDLPGVICGYHLAILRPRGRKIDGRFLHWAISSAVVSGQFHALALGITRFGLRQSAIGQIRVPVPPAAQQLVIADYLGREISRIDALISRKQRLIEVLDSRRRVAVERVIVRDGSESVPLRRLVREVDNRSPDGRGTLLSVSVHLGVVPRGQMTEREGRAEDIVGYKTCRRGDIVLNRMRAFQGAVGVAPEDGLVSPDYAVLRAVSTRVRPLYLHYLLRTPWFVGQLSSIVRGIGSTDLGATRTPRVNVRDLLRLSVPNVSREQQEARAAEADQIMARDNIYRSVVDRSIQMLVERRQALITAAVTEQVQIPEVA